jgi:hypothetical protein
MSSKLTMFTPMYLVLVFGSCFYMTTFFSSDYLNSIFWMKQEGRTLTFFFFIK